VSVELFIDLGAIGQNWRDLSARHPGGPVAAVVKADAYGLGAARVAPYLHAQGCRHFFVAHLAEALLLREHLPDSMLAVLNGLWPGDAETYVEHDITPVLGSIAEIDSWAGRAPAILHVDTGMNRLGLGRAELAEMTPARRHGSWRYIMTHLVSAETPDQAVSLAQAARFAAACVQLPPAPRSLANSSGIFLGPDFASALARPGAALWGVNPTPGRPNPLRPVVTLRARIVQLRVVRVGETVGYNGTWEAPDTRRIATVSVGYADGYPRALSNHGAASFDGRVVPLVGRVSMDLTTFDVTDTTAAAGHWLELIGPHMPVDEVARRAGTNGYEILTQLGRRYSRIYNGA